MSAARLIVVLAVALVLLPGLAGAATPDSGRLTGHLPDQVPVVSIDQPRGTVLDALSAITKQTGWSLVVSVPESATTHPLTLQVSKRPANEVLDRPRGGLAPGLVRRRGPPRSSGHHGRIRRRMARPTA